MKIPEPESVEHSEPEINKDIESRADEEQIYQH